MTMSLWKLFGLSLVLCVLGMAFVLIYPRGPQDDSSALVHSKPRHASGPMYEAATAPVVSNSAKEVVSGLEFISSDKHIAKYQSFFKLRERVVSDLRFNWLIQSTCPPKGPDLLIVVPSVHSHNHERKAIRDTWASVAYGRKWPRISTLENHSIKLVFFLGKSSDYNHRRMVSEADTFGDIVVSDFTDSYRNLSLKMAVVLQWADVYCPNAKHVIKVDEDTFVNLQLLMDVLGVLAANTTTFVLGYRRPLAKLAVTRTLARWKVSPSMYPPPFWPHYLYGHSYVISGNAVGQLRHTSRYMPIITNEDVYVTGVLAKTAGVQRIHSQRMAEVRRVHRRCDLVNNVDISQTAFKRLDLYKVWWNFKTGHC